MRGSRGRGVLAAFHDVIYGTVSLDEWPPEDGDEGDGAWDEFVRARAHARAGEMDEAAGIWRGIASRTGLEVRQALQASYFLREAGFAPAPDDTKSVLGVVVEMPMGRGHDLLAAYVDGSIRHINHTGAIAFEDDPPNEARDAAARWIAVGTKVAEAIGPWDGPALPPLGRGEARITMLTPSGPHLGQGPLDALGKDQMAAGFLLMAIETFGAPAARLDS